MNTISGNAPNFRASKQTRIFRSDILPLFTKEGRVFDLSGPLEPFVELCRSPHGLADALGVLDALTGGNKRSAGFERAVYVIQVDDDPICKIGISANPVERLKDLQGAHYRELFLYGVIFCPTRKSETIEQEVLKRASEAGTRLFGEWIAEDPHDILLAALQVARDKKIDVCDAKTWQVNMFDRTKELYAKQKEAREWRRRMNRTKLPKNV